MKNLFGPFLLHLMRRRMMNFLRLVLLQQQKMSNPLRSPRKKQGSTPTGHLWIGKQHLVSVRDRHLFHNLIEGSEKHTYNGSEHNDSHTSSVVPVEMDTNMSMGDNMARTSTVLILPDSESMDRRHGNTCNPADSGVRIAFDPVDLSLVLDSSQLVSNEFSKRNQLNTGFVSPEFSQRDQLRTGTPSAAQALLTGKLGELAAFKCFIGTLGKTVKWVNKDNETGLPYDLVVEEEGDHIEYIEVKATKSARKDWFNISTREWQFAAEKLKERAEKLENWRMKQKRHEDREKEVNELLRRQSSLWIEGNDLENKILEAMDDTTPL